MKKQLPPDALFSNGCRKRGAGLREGHGRQPAITLVNGGTLKGPESLPEKSTVRHAGHREKVERARRIGCFKLTLSLFRPKIEKWQFFQFDGIYIHYIEKCNVKNFIINADKIFINVSL